MSTLVIEKGQQAGFARGVIEYPKPAYSIEI